MKPTTTADRDSDSDDARRWAAVVARDAADNDDFYYSVKTTGVYCRPSCPSRRAKRENVAFHDSREAAERAGFRPCRRCRPDRVAQSVAHAERIAAACRQIEASESMPTLATLAAGAGLSRHHFHRLFKRITGLTPRQYAAAGRAQRVREHLSHGIPVTQALFAAGYGSSGRFYEAADQVLGMPPSRYRRGGAGSVIRFAVGECGLGSILVAGSDRGICSIALGDDPELLARALQDGFPHAELIGGDPNFEYWVARVVGFVDAPGIGLDLPLDIRGTAFQQRVWQALREIPVGRTASYSEIARRLGSPTAARAVAGACAANPLAIAIPCHRVVRNDGSLSGYRWGIARKHALLEKEAEHRTR